MSRKMREDFADIAARHERGEPVTDQEYRWMMGYEPHPDSFEAHAERLREAWGQFLYAIDEATGFRITRFLDWLSARQEAP